MIARLSFTLIIILSEVINTIIQTVIFSNDGRVPTLIFECDLGHSLIFDFRSLHISVIFASNPPSIGWCEPLLSPSLDPSGHI